MYDIIVNIINMAIAYTIPLLFATMAGFVSGRSGVINLGLEGMMLSGAFFAVIGSSISGSAFIGTFAAMLAGGLFGAFHGLGVVVMRINQIVAGIALNMLAIGTTSLFLSRIFEPYGASYAAASISSFSIGSIKISPFLLLALVALAGIKFLLEKTPIGLRLRAAGEDEESARAFGVRVEMIRFTTLIASGAIAGLAGAYISIGEAGFFGGNTISGRGYLAVAIVLCGRNRLFHLMLLALLVGIITALSGWLHTSIPTIPVQLTQLLPFIIVLIMLAGFPRQTRPINEVKSGCLLTNHD
ncbi:MAG: ABC transporter permease [Pseudomonadota bacterium]